MSLTLHFTNFTNDSVRQAQVFMLCRQTGIILSSIVLARYLPIESVGTLEMLMLCGYLMTFFWSDALLRGYLANSQKLSANYFISSFFWLCVLAGLTAMLLLFIGQSYLVPLFTHRTSLEGLGLFVFYQVLIIPLWISPFTGLIVGRDIILASIFVLIGPAFACWIGLTGISGINGVLTGLLWYAVAGFIWLFTKTQFVLKPQIRNLLKIIWPATWPLVLYAISTGIARSFDAWLVARHFDNESFAVFRYGAREFPLVMAMSAGLSTMMISKLQAVHALKELYERSTRLMHICYPVVAIFIFCSPLLFDLIFGHEYFSSALIFNIYLLLTLTQIIFPQSILMARGDTKLLWYISLAELAVNIIASVILMRVLGLIGIVWGTLIAYVFEKAALMLILYNRYQIRPAAIMNIPVWLGYVLGLSFVFIMTRWVFGI